MTPKGIKWTDEQKASQSTKTKAAMAHMSPEKKRAVALRGHATRRMRQNQAEQEQQ